VSNLVTINTVRNCTLCASQHDLIATLSDAILKFVARPERFELPTLCFEGRCSIQLSYGRTACK
jgi:hypothetical protein